MDALVAYLQVLGTMVRLRRPRPNGCGNRERIMGFETVGEIQHLDLDGLGGAAVRRNRHLGLAAGQSQAFERHGRIPLEDD